MSSERFYAATDGPPKQGDILISGVGRLVAPDRFTPVAWDALDEHHIEVAGGGPGRPPLHLASGHALVMVTSHDGHFDKEWNRRVREPTKQGHSEDEAAALAEADDTLDRTFTASPLIDPDELQLDRGNLMAGRVLGYLPVPSSADGLVPEAVVDLTCRCTLDRLEIARIQRPGEPGPGPGRAAVA